MDIIRNIDKEYKLIIGSKKVKIAAFSTTAKHSIGFQVLPKRSFGEFVAMNFLVNNEKIAENCFRFLDGKVDYFLVDVERKQIIDLEQIARCRVQHSEIITYKPNDVTVEALDILIRNYYADNLMDKKIIIVGNGNLAMKSALRLAERGAAVYVHGRNTHKVSTIVDAFNLILPKHNIHPLRVLGNYTQIKDADLLISFLSADRIIDKEAVDCLKRDALVIDGGINNFTENFYEVAHKKGVAVYRLDVRLGFIYALIPLFPEIQHFFTKVRGRGVINHIPVVAGGIIGKKGEVVVDRIIQPTQVIGIANGIGGILSESEYSESERQTVDKVKEYIVSFIQENI
jgi:hypothetical protein